MTYHEKEDVSECLHVDNSMLTYLTDPLQKPGASECGAS